MFSLLVLTFVSILLNFNCWDNKVLKLRTTDSFIYTELILPDFFYSQAFVETISIMCLVICGTFVMLVALLTSVQARNFCMNKTTSERFAKAKVVQESRTSTYLESAGGSVAESDDLNMSIVEAMQTRDHSYRTCTCLCNCRDMCCLSVHPDQAKIYSIQKVKSESSARGEPDLTLTLGAEFEH